MKKIKIIIILFIAFTLTGCGKNYVGYWCNYEETSNIEIQVEHDINESQREALENTFNKYENLKKVDNITREEFARDLGEDPNSLDIYEAYVLTFDSNDSIGTYIEELSTLPGVHEANQYSAKTVMSLYNIQKHKKYTFTDSDEPNNQDIESGTYKVKKGVITFTSNDKTKSRLLYIKNGHLCGDVECNKIFASSDENCGQNK